MTGQCTKELQSGVTEIFPLHIKFVKKMFLPKRLGTDVSWKTSIHWKLYFLNIVVSVKGIFYFFPTSFFFFTMKLLEQM